VDELQYLGEIEFSALIMALHKIAQKGLPLILVGAGLPQVVGLAGRSKSYAERLFDYPEIGPLSELDAAQALAEPAERAGLNFTPDALAAIYVQPVATRTSCRSGAIRLGIWRRRLPSTPP
jgi:hypothetical protein